MTTLQLKAFSWQRAQWPSWYILPSFQMSVDWGCLRKGLAFLSADLKDVAEFTLRSILCIFRTQMKLASNLKMNPDQARMWDDLEWPSLKRLHRRQKESLCVTSVQPSCQQVEAKQESKQWLQAIYREVTFWIPSVGTQCHSLTRVKQSSGNRLVNWNWTHNSNLGGLAIASVICYLPSDLNRFSVE